jgi:hypothetical protein
MGGSEPLFQRKIALSTMDILLGDRFEGKRIFIKIDVEGVEHAVLCGAGRTMSLDPKPTWVHRDMPDTNTIPRA